VVDIFDKLTIMNLHLKVVIFSEILFYFASISFINFLVTCENLLKRSSKFS